MKLLFFFFFLLVLLSTQISQATHSSVAEAPTPAPTTIDFITIMSKQGCKAFAHLLRLSKALSTYNNNIHAGLTVFCPTDAAVKSFAAEYKNLTDAQKVTLLLYHSVPVYVSLDILKPNNGFMSTLATLGGPNKFEFAVENHGEDVILKSKVNSASVVEMLVDQVPFLAYKIDKVLIPRESFKGKYSGAADAPADGPEADYLTADGPEADELTADDGFENENEMNELDEGNRVNGIVMRFLRFFRGFA